MIGPFILSGTFFPFLVLDSYSLQYLLSWRNEVSYVSILSRLAFRFLFCSLWLILTGLSSFSGFRCAVSYSYCFKYVLSTMGVSKESISKFLKGNRFHVKLRILSPYSRTKNLLIDSLLTPNVESTYLNRDMCKFVSSQKDESRWQSTDSSKAYRNTSAFKCRIVSWSF